mgnify:CR=1 FL=1
MGTLKTSLLSLLVCVGISSCSTLDLAKTAASTLTGQPSTPPLNIKAQVGKSNTINEGLINSDTGDKIDADNVSIDKSNKYSNVDKVVTQNIPIWAIGIMCFGWMFIFITPKQLWDKWRNNNGQG